MSDSVHGLKHKTNLFMQIDLHGSLMTQYTCMILKLVQDCDGHADMQAGGWRDKDCPIK